MGPINCAPIPFDVPYGIQCLSKGGKIALNDILADTRNFDTYCIGGQRRLDCAFASRIHKVKK